MTTAESAAPPTDTNWSEYLRIPLSDADSVGTLVQAGGTTPIGWTPSPGGRREE